MKLKKKQAMKGVYAVLLTLFLIHSGFFSALVDASHTEQQKTETEVQALQQLGHISKTASVEEQQHAAWQYKEALENRISGRQNIPTLPQIGFRGLIAWCKNTFLYLLPWLIVFLLIKSFERYHETLRFARPLNFLETFKFFSVAELVPAVANKGSPLDGFVMEIDHVPDTLTVCTLTNRNYQLK